ncbi:hypothetical protein M9H77_29642 [Catharanthus roseus]|uniref:Uncharacterized protein n=1 Tax=Catharanthus roseus TaxID=4058 RepID=A0ACB9ZW23_CATRO|nr:hypothetical protein M9H77_29642 [Catharanthus roseus]
MEAMRKQQDYQSKHARNMINCYHGGGNGVNAYGGSNHEHGNFISRVHDEYELEKSVSTKESEGKRKESECLIENHESFKEEQVEEKKDEIEKSGESKEGMSSIVFEGDKEEENKRSIFGVLMLHYVEAKDLGDQGIMKKKRSNHEDLEDLCWC